MRLISWNVNGIRAVLNKGFMEFFNEVNSDIFCIQETKMQEGQIEFNLDGYYQYWNSAVKKGYSGTAIFTKEKPISVSYGIGIEEHDQEGRIITLEYEKFYLVNCYTPNSKRELERLEYRMIWEDEIKKYLDNTGLANFDSKVLYDNFVKGKQIEDMNITEKIIALQYTIENFKITKEQLEPLILSF